MEAAKNINNVAWEDKKRVFGIPCTFEKYKIADNRLYVQTGFLKTEINEILLYRILDIKTTVSLWQRIFGVGTITLFSADQSNRTLHLTNVKNPHETHKLISELVEKERESRKVVGRELSGTAVFDMDRMDGSDDE